MKRRLLTCVLLVTILSACDENESNIGLEAENYLTEVLDIMEANSIKKHEIDWTDFRSKVFARVPNAQTIPDTYPAITEALVMLADNHSFFLKPNGGTIFVGTLTCSGQTVSSPTLPDDVGYVKVSQFSGAPNSPDAIAFAEAIQDQIKSQDSADVIGWIVDLRGNFGGNMWPMLAGIGPVLGEGTAGYFIDSDGHETSWGFLNLSSVVDGSNPVTTLGDSYDLIVPNPKVAVLLDNGVASSGEVVAISFIGRENTKSFGEPTCGLSTGNQGFNLSDNASLYLTTVYLADRNKNKFGVPVAPDMTATSEAIIEDALEWIEN